MNSSPTPRPSKADGTPGGFALGHASGDANAWVYWCLWAFGGNLVDRNDKVILNSPETEKALNFAKQLYEAMIPGVAAWNDASNNKAFLAGEIHWTANAVSIYAGAKASPDPNVKAIADDMDHAYWPIGPVGKPTELHLMFPILAMNHTKYPQACKALMAFMMEADNFDPWIEAASGYLSPGLAAYEANPVWMSRPEAHAVSRRRPALAHGRRPRLGRREGGFGHRGFRAGGHVRELLHRPRGRQGRDADRRAAAAADISVGAG